VITLDDKFWDFFFNGPDYNYGREETKVEPICEMPVLTTIPCMKPIDHEGHCVEYVFQPRAKTAREAWKPLDGILLP
jgi:hypothetical protein